jgi:hypothetical protein
MARCASVGGAPRARAASDLLRERRKGAGEECRSEERSTLQMRVSSVNECVLREARRTTHRPAPCASATYKEMGEAPVKYELTGAS